MLRFYLFLLLLIAILQLVVSNNININYTIFSLGCHKFFGAVRCVNGNPIGPAAKAVLKERDDISPDDEIVQTPINANGVFKLEGCDDSDPPTSELEIYVEFFDVCKAGEYKMSGRLKENDFVIYNIYDTAEFAQVD